MKIAKRRGTWAVDYYDYGRRRVRYFPTKRDAEDFAGEQRAAQRQRLRPQVDAHVTVADYAALFLSTKAPALDLKPKTRERIGSALQGHIVPALGAHRLRELDRPTVRAFLEGKLSADASLQGQ